MIHFHLLHQNFWGPINVVKCNPNFYNIHPNLLPVKRLRKKLLAHADVLRTCNRAPEIFSNLIDQMYLVDSVDNYSLFDLIEIHSDISGLYQFLLNKLQSFSDHIKICSFCSEKGNKCNVCKKVEILQAYSNKTSVCVYCRKIYHEGCMSENEDICKNCKLYSF